MNCLIHTCMLLLCIGIAACADRRWCNTQTDCYNNECCVNNYPPRGKRLLSNSHIGHCVALKQHGDSCHVRYGSSLTPPRDVTYDCPCRSPLTCIGSGMVEVPLGETDVSGRKNRIA